MTTKTTALAKEKITLPIGDNKTLVFEADQGSKTDMDFAKLCRQLAATKPQSLQEFFIRLNDLQNNIHPEPNKKQRRKI